MNNKQPQLTQLRQTTVALNSLVTVKLHSLIRKQLQWTDCSLLNTERNEILTEIWEGESRDHPVRVMRASSKPAGQAERTGVPLSEDSRT